MDKETVSTLIEVLPSLHDTVEYIWFGKIKTGQIIEINGKRIKVGGTVSNGRFSMAWHNWIVEGHIIRILSN